MATFNPRYLTVLLICVSIIHTSCIRHVDDDSLRRRRSNHPNFLLLVADDMGYNDIASYGHPTQEYGPVDWMATAGLRFTQAYVPDTVCTPSRSAFLTGRLPVRIGTYGNTRVFLPWARTGLPRDEYTMAEALKDAGYITGMVGKWHLGINSQNNSDGYHLPMHHGFDFVGHFLPFTNSFDCDDTGRHLETSEISVEKCILMNANGIVAQPYNHTYLTQTFVNDATGFIRENKDKPFFLYYPMAHPHVSLFSSPRFTGSSRRGIYGDNINEMNWAIGEILSTLKENGIAENTLVIFMSDHGPQPEYCEEGGDSGFLRGYKSNTWEGGVRIPLIAYWPGTIKPGVSTQMISSLDLIQTFTDLAGATLPSDRQYDGTSIRGVLLKNDPSPHKALFFYCTDRLMAVRKGAYKIHYHTHRIRTREDLGQKCGPGGFPFRHYFDCNDCYGDCITSHVPPLVYHLGKDPSESYPLDPENPTISELLSAVDDLVRTHKATIVPGGPLCDDQDDTHSIVPCCDPDNKCMCNNGPVTGPYN